MINKLVHLLFLTVYTTPRPHWSEFLCMKTTRLDEARELDEDFEVRWAPRTQHFPHKPECPPQPSRSRGLAALPFSVLRPQAWVPRGPLAFSHRHRPVCGLTFETCSYSNCFSPCSMLRPGPRHQRTSLSWMPTCLPNWSPFCLRRSP